MSSQTALVSRTPGDYEVESYETTLTLKSVITGAARYYTERKSYLITPGQFLILNNGQRYGLRIDERDKTRTFCLFFQPGLIEEVAEVLKRDDMDLLSQGYDMTAEPIRFVEKTYQNAGRVTQLLSSMATELTSQQDREIIQEHVYDITSELVRLKYQTDVEVNRIQCKKKITRNELYRRVCDAHDQIRSCYADSLTIARLSRTACLSPYHFQRSFKQVFGLSPMQELRRVRLKRAQTLLAGTDQSITEICQLVGFSSVGSFGSLFKRLFGCSPGQYRHKKYK